ncbi:MAG: hypothetical protein M3444_04175 [Acidobacteriota bacterium]|nr:hypothetical protein [Acidobacteriota bacterium]
MSRNILTLVSFLILALATPVVAQQQQQDDQEIKKILNDVLGPKRAGQTQPIPEKRKFNHKIKIETKYDRFSNSTDVQMEHTEVYHVHGSRPQKISMTVLFTYPGETPAKPGSVTIAFNSWAPEWKYLRYRDLTILADGRKAGPVTMELINTRIERDGTVTETLSTTMVTDVFLFMVNASSVEMQLGDAEFTLKPEHLEALRDLASRMQP